MTAHKLARELIDALGLPERTTSLQINMAAGKPMTVKCEYLPNVQEDPARRAIKLLRFAHFNEVPSDENTDALPSIGDQIESAKKRLHYQIEAKCELAQLAIHRDATLAMHRINWNLPLGLRISIAVERALQEFENAQRGCVQRSFA